MQKWIITFGILCVSWAQAGELPQVTAEQLQVGNHWTWSYYTEGDRSRFYSAERYEVIEVQGDQVLFEVRSKYNEQSEFTPSTRFRVNLDHCRRAFTNPEVKVNFSIELYPYKKDHWSKVAIATPSTAFEEKFNCNSVVHAGRNSLYETRYDSVADENGEWQVFQQWPKSPKSQLRSFYYLDREGLAGVAQHKSFNPGTVGYYEMVLTDYGASVL